MRATFSVVLTALAVLAIVLLSRDIVPPKTLTMSVGSPSGGYWKVADRYKQILARDNIDLKLLASAGSVENAARLADRQADAALLQGGIPSPVDTQSIGAVFYEPLLIFSRRSNNVPANPALWSGLKIATGAPGSGTRAAFADFETAASVPVSKNTKLPVSGRDAASALLDGNADLAVFVAPVSAPYLERLFTSPLTRLLRLDHINAIASRMQADVTELPTGAASMLPPVPDEPIAVVVTTAQIVTQDGLHPSLVDRLVEAAREVHSTQDVVTPARQFPAPNGGRPVMDAYAQKLIENGSSPLQEYLPYWVVAQINRFAILLLPIFILLLPLLRTLPGLYSWQMRRRVFSYYPKLRAIDDAIEQTTDKTELQTLGNHLADIDRELNELKLPLAFRENAYTARLHTDLIRSRLDKRLQRVR